MSEVTRNIQYELEWYRKYSFHNEQWKHILFVLVIRYPTLHYFPLKHRFFDFTMVYLDNSATTAVDEDVLEIMLPWFREQYGNASSIYSIGRKARVVIEEARTTIASLINAHPAEIIFTSGGTESNNTILKSCIYESGLVDRIAVGSTEHHAVLHPIEQLHSEGKETGILSVNSAGCIDLEKLSEWNKPRTLISIMHANNETGIVQSLKEVRGFCNNTLFHSDAVQSFGKIPFNVEENGVDFATFSAHKIHGPKGIGAMYIRKGIDFKAHQQGGGQERNRRAGTEATALIVGFAYAAKKAHEEMEKRASVMKERTRLLRSLLQDINGIRFNTPEDNVLPSILNVSFEDAEKLDGEAIIQSLDIHGIAASNGSACVSGSMQPSHVLMAMGRSKAESKAAVRFSVSKDTTEDDIRKASEALHDVISSLRG